MTHYLPLGGGAVLHESEHVTEELAKHKNLLPRIAHLLEDAGIETAEGS